MSDWNIRNFLKRESVSFVRSGWLPPSWTGPLSVPTLTSSWNVIPIGSCVYIYSFNGVVLWLAINSRNTCHPWLFQQCWYVLLDWRQYHRRKITHQMLSLIPHLPVCTINYGDCSAFILFYKKKTVYLCWLSQWYHVVPTSWISYVCHGCNNSSQWFTTY